MWKQKEEKEFIQMDREQGEMHIERDNLLGRENLLPQCVRDKPLWEYSFINSIIGKVA